MSLRLPFVVTLAVLALSFVACGGLDPRATDPNFRKAQEAEAKKAEEQAEADRKAERDRPKPNRENYNRVKNGMTPQEVQDILGSGKEAASGPGVAIVTWQSKPELGKVPNVISVTFQNGKVTSKAIAGP